MKTENRKYYIISGVLLLVAVIYILLVKTVDVAPIGPNGTEVGFSTVNGFFKDKIGNNMTWYDITKYLGYLTLLFVPFYAFKGLMQLVKEKSLAKVDKKIIVLGVFYAVVLAIYVLFEIVVINYRPFIIDGELEASFPSSHTMLALCVCGSSIMLSKYFFKNDKLRKILNVLTAILLITVWVGRIISGVHWISDIIGGAIISAFLLMALYATVKTIDSKEEK